MDIVGLVARAALLKQQMKKKPCERCGQLFDHDALVECPHCGGLNETQLQAMLELKEEGFKNRRSLGFLFMVVAVTIAAFMLVVELGDL